MDKILGTSLGRNSELVFDLEGRLVTDSNLPKVMAERCNNHDIYKNEGVIVHMTRREYEELQRQHSS
ncbi:MAG: hypothetical protein AABX54_01745 [Nanoarchaeota archaeon]